MNRRSMSLLLLLATATLGVLEAQVREEMMLRRGRDVVRPDELVSFRSDMAFGEAISALSEMSRKFSNKPILDPTTFKKDTPIGVNIESMDWRSAFELILRTNQLWYNEQPEFFQITMLTPTVPGRPGAPAEAVVDSTELIAKAREVTISAIFLEIDQTRLRESGLSFGIFRGRDLNLGVEFNASDRVGSNIFGAVVTPTSPRLAVDIAAAIRIFESEQIGEVIARPQVSVRSGVPGRVQIGSDFSIKQRDIAGNVTDQFFSTGTILNVLPKVYQYGKHEFIDISVSVERSTPQPGTVSSIVNKSQVSSKLTLLDGEESYIGGLYTNEEVITREGIPLLKDLPWWFFGLRYLFGYDAVRVTRKELIVLLKAELLPLIEERMAQQRRNALEEKLRESREDLEKRQQRKQ